MTARPTFVRPHLAWFLVLDGGVVATTALAFSDSAHAAASQAGPVPSRATARRLVGLIVFLHVGEALVARRLARRYGLPAGRWARQTLAVGFPSLLALRRVVRPAG